MDCLIGYIGLDGCGAENASIPNPIPTGETAKDYFSGLYINHLPGISLQSIEKIAVEERKNYLGVWEAVQQRALLKLGTSFRGHANSKFNIADQTVTDCLVCSNKKSFSIALWYLLGAEMMTERISSDRVNRWTTVDLEKAERLRGEYLAEFTGYWQDALNSIDFANSDCVEDVCLEHNCNVSFIERLP